VRLPGAVTKNKRPLPLALTGQLLALVARRWALRVPECPFVFHRSGRRSSASTPSGPPPQRPSASPGLLFHNLRRRRHRGRDPAHRGLEDQEHVLPLQTSLTSATSPTPANASRASSPLPPVPSRPWCPSPLAPPARGAVESTRTEHGQFRRFWGCTDHPRRPNLLTSLTRRGGGTGRRRRLKIARVHTLEGSTPFLGTRQIAELSTSASKVRRRVSPKCPRSLQEVPPCWPGFMTTRPRFRRLPP
jgi:hypothetical protein